MVLTLDSEFPPIRASSKLLGVLACDLSSWNLVAGIKRIHFCCPYLDPGYALCRIVTVFKSLVRE